MKTPLIHGFFVLRDIASGLYLTSKDININAFRPLNHEVSIYRSNKQAIKGAKEAIAQFVRLRLHWIKNGDVEIKKIYSYPFVGIEVVELSLTEKSVNETVKP